MHFLYLYYNQPEAIEHLGKFYKDKDFQITFVDDGSLVPLNLAHWKNANVHRIEEDVKWNQAAATNFGLSKITDKIVFRSDIDHWVGEDDIESFLKIVPRAKEIIRFRRVVHYPNKEPYDLREPPNIYVANTDEIRECGYDERFCGNYGYEDTEFFHRATKKHGFRITVHPTIKVNVKIGLHTTGLNRNPSVNKKLLSSLMS